jgi:hypothetical protein
LSKKFQKTPIKTIVFDDPNQKYIDSLILLLDNVFVKQLDFQIILLTHVENIETTWKKEEFQYYDGNMSIGNENFTHIIDKWKKSDYVEETIEDVEKNTVDEEING